MVRKPKHHREDRMRFRIMIKDKVICDTEVSVREAGKIIHTVKNVEFPSYESLRTQGYEVRGTFGADLIFTPLH